MFRVITVPCLRVIYSPSLQQVCSFPLSSGTLWEFFGILVTPGIESWTLVILDWHCTADPLPLSSEADSRSFAYLCAQTLTGGFQAGALPLRTHPLTGCFGLGALT